MSDSKKYWYFISMIYCPVCFKTEVYGERRYDDRPENYYERHEMTEIYDYCNG